jgi:hypothetical protein
MTAEVNAREKMHARNATQTQGTQTQVSQTQSNANRCKIVCKRKRKRSEIFNTREKGKRREILSVTILCTESLNDAYLVVTVHI